MNSARTLLPIELLASDDQRREAEDATTDRPVVPDPIEELIEDLRNLPQP